MGFRYLDRIATREHIEQFLSLADLAAGAGDSAANVFLLSHRLRDTNPMKLCLKRLQREPACQALIDQRHISGAYDAAALRALPPGSLGHTDATVLETMGYDINFFPKPDFFASLETDADYVNYRVYATHYIHHIVTGFSLDNFGELGVISLSVAQFSHPGLAFTDLMALLLSWFMGDTPIDQLESIEEQARTTGYAFGMISQGIEMGLAAQPLFPVLWEERMAQNLEELRSELGIQPVRDGQWSWESNSELRKALEW